MENSYGTALTTGRYPFCVRAERMLAMGSEVSHRARVQYAHEHHLLLNICDPAHTVQQLYPMNHNETLQNQHTLAPTKHLAEPRPSPPPPKKRACLFFCVSASIESPYIRAAARDRSQRKFRSRALSPDVCRLPPAVFLPRRGYHRNPSCMHVFFRRRTFCLLN